MTEILDLGMGHTLQFTSWKPDRSIPENAERYKDLDDIEKYGALVRHKKPDGSECCGSVRFDTPEVNRVDPNRGPGWQVESWEPLTISPSLLCSCGDHGFIRSGKWVPA